MVEIQNINSASQPTKQKYQPKKLEKKAVNIGKFTIIGRSSNLASLRWLRNQLNKSDIPKETISKLLREFTDQMPMSKGSTSQLTINGKVMSFADSFGDFNTASF